MLWDSLLAALGWILSANRRTGLESEAVGPPSVRPGQVAGAAQRLEHQAKAAQRLQQLTKTAQKSGFPGYGKRADELDSAELVSMMKMYWWPLQMAVVVVARRNWPPDHSVVARVDWRVACWTACGHSFHQIPQWSQCYC